ncbi:hypothetical protein [Methanobacterium congolense]|nr:hypothetical protein [Methanobacterium congolense]
MEELTQPEIEKTIFEELYQNLHIKGMEILKTLTSNEVKNEILN